MKEIAPGVFQLGGFPPNAINVYVIGDVLIDAATKLSGRRIFRQLKGRTITAHALTHAHADHQGASAAICAARAVPLWCAEAEREVAESGEVTRAYPNPADPVARFQQRYWAGPGWPVARTLREGDAVGDFCVVETPGHAPGHLALWRERDGVLIAGDVLVDMHMLTTARGLHEPPTRFTADPHLNRQSIKKLAAMKPKVICFGHGPALHNPAPLLALAARL